MENGSSADVVTKVVLKAVTSENPSLRYLAGKDVETLIAAKKNMSDEEFYNMMKTESDVLECNGEGSSSHFHSYCYCLD
ncbi:MAG: hypothetical protein WCC17_18975 [Candidatus Nitrosopolaris sp.]